MQPLPIFYLNQVYQQLSLWECNVNIWLRHNGITLEQLQDPYYQVSFDDYQRLINSAINLSARPDLGLHVGNRISINTHGMMGFAMLNSSTLKQAIDTLKQFINTRTPLVRVNIHETADTMVITFQEVQPLGVIQQPFMDALLVTIAKLLQQLSPHSPALCQINLSFPAPTYWQQYSALTKVPVHFNQASTQFILTQTLLTQRLEMADPSSFMQARQWCINELDLLNGQQSLSDKLYQYLLPSPMPLPSLSDTAAHFHMTPRTLHRHLAQQQSSYKTIVASVNHHIAKHYLSQSQGSIKQLAYQLGYVDVTNFRRAFKRWQGMTPSEYRQQQKTGSEI
ncbi:MULTISPECIES: AraC family transcriptional regulator [Shewanella]|uniref:AraC family transcriptional regulator n=1 Tax=Shewanella psychromarinicola TaxID=2487742 RepID=A0A3N4DPL2_9GAMM|nr:AraC family transcriptional regulator [Shewanella psychromarinicola]AZG33503.1 AraC family transcriptional regulator [Shewanella psychromarinicola]MCL1082384.1 AraC family transcriptional regulator [Shewanella psychromarinicola]RPA27805.1 AraC family transcriptional regulator [Shewanella psychromarinicola]